MCLLILTNKQLPMSEDLRKENARLKAELEYRDNHHFDWLRRKAAAFHAYHRPRDFPPKGWERNAICEHGEPVVCCVCGKVLCHECQQKYFNTFLDHNANWAYECGNCEADRRAKAINEKLERKREKERLQKEKSKFRQEKWKSFSKKCLSFFQRVKKLFNRSPKLDKPTTF